MPVRTAVAVSIAATALSLAAPVAAHAESHDCIVIRNYAPNLWDLINQANGIIDISTDASDNGDIPGFLAHTRTAARLHRAIGDQFRTIASQMASPLYQDVMNEAAAHYREYGNIEDVEANTYGHISPSVLDRGSQLGDLVVSDIDTFRNTAVVSCENS